MRPERVLIDHVEEHTIGLALDAGHWAGMTLYPVTKCSPARAVDLLECYGSERLWINSAGDWGPSDPLSVPKCMAEMRRRGHRPDQVRRVVLENPTTFLQQSGRFELGDAEA